jgi:ABC-type transport system involved in multi-copper enzyme maturation permease subunit
VSAPQALAAPSPAPDWLDRLGARLADRTNPIVVKELRQHLRTKVFWVFFSLMLLVCLLISVVTSLAASSDDDAGLGSFAAYFVALSVVQHFVIPFTAFRSMVREQEDETWVLLCLTGLGARRILAGKVASFVLQGLLYASAATPFLVFSYSLNGIDLPTIGVAMVLGAVFQVFLVSVSVSLASLGETRLVRALAQFVVLGLLGMAFFSGVGVIAALSREVSRSSADAMLWVAVGGGAFALLTTALLLFEAAAARLSMPTEPYARGPRLLFAVQALGAVGAFVVAWRVGGSQEPLVAGLVVFLLQVAFVGTFIASDRDSMAKNHWATHGRFWLLAPGALRGLLTVLLVLAVGTAVFVGCLFSVASPREYALNLALAGPGYLLLYLCAPLVIARWFPHPPWQTPALVRLIALGLFTVGSGVPPLFAAAVSEGDDRALNLLNPIVGLVNVVRDGEAALPQALVVAAFGGAATLAALATLWRRDVRWA